MLFEGVNYVGRLEGLLLRFEHARFLAHGMADEQSFATYACKKLMPTLRWGQSCLCRQRPCSGAPGRTALFLYALSVHAFQEANLQVCISRMAVAARPLRLHRKAVSINSTHFMSFPA